MALIPAALLLPGTLPVDDLDLPEEGTKYELKLHHLHTGESIDVVYRIGDTYIPTAMAELNHFLRDHRTEDQSKYETLRSSTCCTMCWRGWVSRRA